MSWFYSGLEFTSDLIEDNKSFVYIVTNTVTGKQYIGKKRFEFSRTKKLKDKKRKIREFKESDWMDYYGSSQEVAKDIVRYGKEAFRRDIIRLCKSHAEATYWELFEQMDRHVLLDPVRYYNSYVGSRIHRNHIVRKKDGSRRNDE